MRNTHYCSECDVEFKVRHDEEDDSFLVMYCPFCGSEIEQQDLSLYDEKDEDA